MILLYPLPVAPPRERCAITVWSIVLVTATVSSTFHNLVRVVERSFLLVRKSNRNKNMTVSYLLLSIYIVQYKNNILFSVGTLRNPWLVGPIL